MRPSTSASSLRAASAAGRTRAAPGPEAFMRPVVARPSSRSRSRLHHHSGQGRHRRSLRCVWQTVKATSIRQRCPGATLTRLRNSCRRLVCRTGLHILPLLDFPCEVKLPCRITRMSRFVECSPQHEMSLRGSRLDIHGPAERLDCISRMIQSQTAPP